MNLITRNTDYAIKALCFIAGKKKEIVSVRGLVKKLKIPRPFLRKILQELTRESILTSYKGKGGGFVLARPAKKISVADMIRVFQGPIKLQEHFFKKGTCRNIKACVLKKRLDIVEKHLISELSSITVADLAKGGVKL